MTALYIAIITVMLVIVCVVLKGNRNLIEDNRRKDTEIRTLRSRLREMNHEQ